MRIVRTADRRAIDALVAVDRARDPRIARQAAAIVRDVRRRGDAALRAWGRRLGETAPLVVEPRELRAGWAATPRQIRAALRLSIRHLARVSARQMPRPFVVRPAAGVTIAHRVLPIARVGCYVPAGRHPLASTLVMTVVPARIAGVQEIVVACPHPTPAVLCAALEAGATRVFRVGGAQAIGAMAYGTATIPRVDKIVGPGNAWVSAAKALVSADCAVDAHAGPSEIVILADTGDPGVVASDLVAQAEHDPDARAILITTRARFASAVARAVQAQARTNPTARQALARNGAIVVAAHTADAIALVNRIAPEHLVCARARDVARIAHAGTIFVGRWTAPAAGDYCTGSNHVLPTGGAARVRGGLGAADFVRVSSVQTLTRAGLGAIANAAAALAGLEGLTAHAASIRMRGAPSRGRGGRTQPRHPIERRPR
jgi:histidinol dehydrogenase